MAFKSTPERARFGVVHIDLGIVTASQDFVTVEEEARNHMAMVSSESKMLRLTVFHHPSLANQVVTLIQRLEQMHSAKGFQSDGGVRNSLRGGVG